MRTNIDIDDRLMRDAIRASGERTKRAVVERALRLLVQTRAQAGIRRLRGKIQWQGDLIATFCLTRGHALLHNDRNFDPFEEHLGLTVIHPFAQP